MGDRSNIVVVSRGWSSGEGGYVHDPLKDTRVYLYGHWMGDKAIEHAVHGLRSGRVNDPSYLARIIFCSMVKESIEGKTSFGISAVITDNEYPVIVIDGEGGEVWLEDGNTSPVTPKVTVARFLQVLDDHPTAQWSLDGLVGWVNGEASE